jgi:hypothetical protein
MKPKIAAFLVLVLAGCASVDSTTNDIHILRVERQGDELAVQIGWRLPAWDAASVTLDSSGGCDNRGQSDVAAQAKTYVSRGAGILTLRIPAEGVGCLVARMAAERVAISADQAAVVTTPAP